MVNIRPGVMFLPVFHKDQSLQCNPKLFADGFSLFATVHNINKATIDLNNDLTKTTKWTFQWKMSFNPDISKQAHEVISPRKRSITSFGLKRIPKNIWECSLIGN